MFQEYREMTDRLAEHQKRLEDLNDTLEREEDEGYRSVANSVHTSRQSLPHQTHGQVFFPPTHNSINPQQYPSSRHARVGKCSNFQYHICNASFHATLA